MFNCTFGSWTPRFQGPGVFSQGKRPWSSLTAAWFEVWGSAKNHEITISDWLGIIRYIGNMVIIGNNIGDNIGNNHPIIFFRGVAKNHQPVMNGGTIE
jgi:hypothetical protein